MNRKEMIELGERAERCDGWEWMEGMLVYLPDGDWRRLQGPYYLRLVDVDTVDYFDRATPVIPDLTDSATLGCLIALVRKAWDHPGLHVRLESNGWRNWTDEPGALVHDSEAEALVCALESAP